MNVWYVIYAVVMTLALVVIHEAAHGIALRRLGIPIEEVGLGLQLPPRLVVKPRWLPFRLSVSPWVIIAYVMPDRHYDDQLERLDYHDKCWYSGAGVFINFVVGTGVLAVVSFLQGSAVQSLILTMMTIVTCVFRQWFVSYAVPVLSLGAAFFMVFVLATVDEGPIGPAAYATMPYTPPLLLAGLLSLSLAVLNALPIYPLDGGRIVGHALERFAGRRVVEAYKIATGFLSLVLIVYVLLTDFLWIVSG